MAHADRHGDRRQRGDAVEDAALAFLERQGLRLLARNHAVRAGELDLVMLESRMHDDPIVVFVEVRYRAAHAFGGGAASVDARKRRRLIAAAQAFLAGQPAYAMSACRFDVVAASGDPHAPGLEWLRDAFRADEG